KLNEVAFIPSPLANILSVKLGLCKYLGDFNKRITSSSSFSGVSGMGISFFCLVLVKKWGNR
ncbi:hypothetical protein, partial [Parabacteroides goldsteinii]|uniref:hypothetical protein n=1 Tax=Parabacteroides goldsteinii TaxID=328812 RepID=UPI00256EC057